MAYPSSDKQQLPGILIGGKFSGVRRSELFSVGISNERFGNRHFLNCKKSTSSIMEMPHICPSSEDAVEYDELDIFLKLKESWNPDVDEHIAPPVTPIGVPGAAMPLEMTPERLRDKVKVHPTASPLNGKKPVPVNKREGEVDLGDELAGFGLQGLKATDDELRDLLADLGLDGDDAGDLLKGLGGDSAPNDKAAVEEGDARAVSSSSTLR